MIYRNGTYILTDTKNPDSWGVCDRTGQWMNTRRLKKQYEWAGDRKIWTGQIVGDCFLDEPNEQLRAPKQWKDPTVVDNPRIPIGYELSPPMLSQAEILVQLSKVSFTKGVIPIPFQ
jgi:hypothetical protein